jgi:heme-degrading monooxygenase HmoA
MFATIRRYESVDQARASELITKADESLLPALSEVPGFHGYHLIQANDGVFSSVSFFDTAAHADESNRVASDWVREQKLESALPNPPKVTGGEVVVSKTSELVQA